MNPKTLAVLKTVLAAGFAAVLHSIAENLPQIQAVIPPKYAGLVAAVGSGIALYFAESPVSNSKN